MIYGNGLKSLILVFFCSSNNFVPLNTGFSITPRDAVETMISPNALLSD